MKRFFRLNIMKNKLFLSAILFIFLFINSSFAAIYDDFEDAVEDLSLKIAKRAEKKAKKGSKVAIVGVVENRSKQKWELSGQIESSIIDTLSNSDHFQVLERDRIDAIEEELYKQHANVLFDNKTAKKIGSLAGADIVVTGSFEEWGNNLLKIRLRIINIKTGIVLGSGNVKVTTDRIKPFLKPITGQKIVKTEPVPEKEEPLPEPEIKEEPKPEVKLKGKFFIEVEPQNANIRILNIGPTFHQGIELDEGKYHVEVSASGYKTKRKWIALNPGESKSLIFSLNKKPIQKIVKSASRKGNTWIDPILSAKFVYIKPGSFMMGSPSSESKREDDETRHRVTLTKGFYMQTTEVTQGQWKKIMGSNPSDFKSCGDNCPVEDVSWYDSKDFIQKLNQRSRGNKYRLPTEAEWEYSARAGTTTPFNTGKCLSTSQANYDGNYPYTGCSKGEYRKTTVSVASFSPNAWGLYDMHGNVWEWCQDWYGEYPTSSVTDPTGPISGSFRVLRGGSWHDYARGCRSANRYGSYPDFADYRIGFRLAVSPGQ